MIALCVSKISKKSLLATGVVTALFYGAVAQGAVPATQASQLSSTLTPFGAERDGNAAGSIPAWDGGITTPPQGYQAGEHRIDPYADDKVLFTITASNYQEYKDKLSEGQRALFEKYPDSFKMNVYPTRRSHAAPQWVADNTLKNATNAQLAEGGNGVSDAYGGIPFPIPQNGLEAIWNHSMRWAGEANFKEYGSYVVYDNGQVNQTSAGNIWEKFPYYAKGGTPSSFDGTLFRYMISYSEPTRRKGEIILVNDAVDQVKTPRQAWQYIPGQRRVRRAPTIAYDTPNPSTGGQSTYDDVYLYNGSPDRYDWKLVGKQEVYLPYNSYRFVSALGSGVEATELLSPGHPNPDFERWELHRVWVVEATLKDGKRHIYGKRRFYLDEDSWVAAMADSFDGRGELWRTSYGHLFNAYEVPATVSRSYIYIDLFSGIYAAGDIDLKALSVGAGEKDSFFTPRSIRKLAKR